MIGVREALSWIKKKAGQKVVVERHSLMVMQSIRSPLSMLSYLGSVISDCKNLLQYLHNV